MRNPVTKLTAAVAIIAVAALVGIIIWSGTNSGTALANVLAQVQQITAYRFRATGTVSGKGAASEDMNKIKESALLISRDYGMKIATDTADPNGGRTRGMEAYVLFQEKVMIILRPNSKDYIRLDLNDAEIEKIRHQYYDPSSMLKEILGSKYESLGRSTVDGVEVEGFRATDPKCLHGTTDQGDMKIWIDAKTRLPVRLEINGEKDGAQVHGVVHDFQWNYPVDADTFKVVIPADYTNLDKSMEMAATDDEDDIAGPKLLDKNEEGAIAGLKVYADVTGRYPERLDSVTFVSLSEVVNRGNPALRRLREETTQAIKQLAAEKLSPEEKDKRIQELIKNTHERSKKVIEEQSGGTKDKFMPVSSTVMFYERLVMERKDPAYYGSIVTPQDAGKILMRWKISDNQYRVIFGSLHAETVDAQTLAELEKDLPK